MSSRLVPAAEWPSFLARFGREHRAWLTSVERVAPGHPPRLVACSRPLDAVIARQDAGKPMAIEVRFQDAGRPTGLVVGIPTAIRVDETAEGAERGVEIEDADGTCMRVRFRATALPETLDGVAPGEL